MTIIEAKDKIKKLCKENGIFEQTYKADHLFDSSLEQFNKANADMKFKHFQFLKKELERNEMGKKIGFPLAKEYVIAGEVLLEFLGDIQPKEIGDNIRVCMVDSRTCSYDGQELPQISDDEFLEIATEQNTVYALKQFQSAWNKDAIIDSEKDEGSFGFDYQFLRILEV